MSHACSCPCGKCVYYKSEHVLCPITGNPETSCAPDAVWLVVYIIKDFPSVHFVIFHVDSTHGPRARWLQQLLAMATLRHGHIFGVTSELWWKNMSKGKELFRIPWHSYVFCLVASEEHEKKGRTEPESKHISWRKLSDICINVWKTTMKVNTATT